jgi:hypothetical protein
VVRGYAQFVTALLGIPDVEGLIRDPQWDLKHLGRRREAAPKRLGEAFPDRGECSRKQVFGTVAGTDYTVIMFGTRKKHLYKSALHQCSIEGVCYSADGQRQSETIAQFDKVRHVVGEIALVHEINRRVLKMVEKIRTEKDLQTISQLGWKQVLDLMLETGPAVRVRAEEVVAFQCAVLEQSIEEVLINHGLSHLVLPEGVFEKETIQAA